MTKSHSLPFLTVLSIVMLAGCNGDAVFGITSLSDDFDATVSDDGDSGSTTSDWVNAGSQADVSFSLGVGTTGQVKLTIRDAGGDVVYQQTISSDGQDSRSGVTLAGTPGTWEVKLEVSNLNGTASISLSRA